MGKMVESVEYESFGSYVRLNHITLKEYNTPMKPMAVICNITYLEDQTTEDQVVSVHVPDMSEFLQPNQFFIKDYSEGKPLALALMMNGLVLATGQKLRSGFVTIPVVELTEAGKEWVWEPITR